MYISLGDRRDEDEFGLRKERTWWWTVREGDFKLYMQGL